MRLQGLILNIREMKLLQNSLQSPSCRLSTYPPSATPHHLPQGDLLPWIYSHRNQHSTLNFSYSLGSHYYVDLGLSLFVRISNGADPCDFDHSRGVLGSIA